MRRQGLSSELARLAAPLTRVFDAAWRRMHWWIAALVLLYALSGVTVIRSDEVAIVERWGRLVGDTPAEQQHGAGLLFAFPRPIDEVVRVRTKFVQQQSVITLAVPAQGLSGGTALDPVLVGYALTGDQNIVHVGMIARYRVRDPAEWAFYGPDPEQILRTEVSAALVRSVGEIGVDRVLAEERKDLTKTVTQRVQSGLDAAHAGLELVALELTSLSPPIALLENFNAVQTAYIGAETDRKDAQAFALSVVPGAHATADRAIESARADAAEEVARARGDAAAFAALEREHRANPALVREQLYRDAVEKAFSRAGPVRWIPPPDGRRHSALRLQIGSDFAGPAPSPLPETQPPTDSSAAPPGDDD